MFEDLSPATQDDVRQLILAGLEEHWGEIDESLNPDLDDMLTAYAAGRTVVSLGDHGEAVGTGTLVPRASHVAEIVRMSVHRDARRTGLGRQIVNELVETARSWGCELVVLETSTAWTDVVSFYEDCGFTVTHTTPSEFGDDTWFEMRLSDQG